MNYVKYDPDMKIGGCILRTFIKLLDKDELVIDKELKELCSKMNHNNYTDVVEHTARLVCKYFSDGRIMEALILYYLLKDDGVWMGAREKRKSWSTDFRKFLMKLECTGIEKLACRCGYDNVDVVNDFYNNRVVKSRQNFNIHFNKALSRLSSDEELYNLLVA